MGDKKPKRGVKKKKAAEKAPVEKPILEPERKEKPGRIPKNNKNLLHIYRVYLRRPSGRAREKNRSR